MTKKNNYFTRANTTFYSLALVAAGAGLWACSAEFEDACPEGTTQTAGGGDVSDACTPNGQLSGAGGGSSVAGAGGTTGSPAAGQGGSSIGEGEGGGGLAGAAGGGAGQAGAGGGTAGPTALVRFAHLSPDAPAFDVCLSANGAFDEPPVLKTAGLASGITYLRVTTYLPTKTGRVSVRLVQAAATECTNNLPGSGDFTLDNVTATTHHTVGIMGKLNAEAGQNALKCYLYNDKDVGADTENKVEHRIVNALSDLPSTAIGSFLGRRPKPEDAGEMAFGGVSAGSPGNVGYIQIDPIAEPNAHVNPIRYFIEQDAFNGGNPFMFLDALTGPTPGVPPTVFVSTAFIVGEVKKSSRSDNVLFCDDRSSTLQGVLLTSCSLSAQRNPLQ